MNRDLVLIKNSETECDETHEPTEVDCLRELPRIDVTDERVPTVAAVAWAALRDANRGNERPRFVRMGDMAVMRTEKGLEVLTKASLTYELARAAVFYRVNRNGEKVVRPPAWLVADMLTERAPDLPEEQQ
jgi:hypothetical protein